ncbi:Hypothetical protein CAP_6299 [Chondromyces apiculatus DSM 436]|uniref:Uncharacterized protein n=1 Tax=Chondromyces apiculatus DSM 436 TaxID=1192034 RepID=A0A017T3D9_9BACT|nr:Hypothetical protein CAP_6299 [Chondromyces apiculatus DSM 436]
MCQRPPDHPSDAGWLWACGLWLLGPEGERALQRGGRRRVFPVDLAIHVRLRSRRGQGMSRRGAPRDSRPLNGSCLS